MIHAFTSNEYPKLFSIYRCIGPGRAWTMPSSWSTWPVPLAGIATFLYISKRIYEQLIADNPISLLPLLRPFALVLVITFWAPFVQLLMVPTKGLDQALRSGLCPTKNTLLPAKLEEKQDAILAVDLPSFQENEEKEALTVG